MRINSNKKIHGVILNGGRSSRMGQDKGAMLFREHSLLERAVHLLESLDLHSIAISGGTPQNSLTHIPDLKAGLGPLGAINSSVQFMLAEKLCEVGDNLMFIPVDMPMLSEALMQILLDAHFELNHPHAVTHFMDEPLPSVMTVSEQLPEVVSSILASDNQRRGFSLRALYNRIYVNELPVPDAAKSELVNCNSPDDWLKLNAKQT